MTPNQTLHKKQGKSKKDDHTYLVFFESPNNGSRFMTLVELNIEKTPRVRFSLRWIISKYRGTPKWMSHNGKPY